MLDIFSKILCAVTNVAWWTADLLVMLANALLIALGAFLSLVVSLLPSMPDPPANPTSGVLGYVNWFFPVGGLVLMFAVVLSLWTAVLLLRVALRWVKAL